MSEDDQHSTAVSRRGLLGGVAAMSAGAVVGLGGSVASALPPSAQPEALGATSSSLTYLPIDGLALFTYVDVGTEGRYFDELTGTGANAATGRRLGASLPLPVGSVIYQLNVAYQVQPIIEIHRRDLVNPNPSALPLQLTLLAGPGAKTQTIDLTTPITIEQGATYSLQFYVLPGDTVYGVTVGYVPPTQAFQPFVGSTPRVLDTRLTGGKLAPNEERVIALGFPGARGAVLNVTVADTEGAGFIAVNRAGIAWPNNSTLNWSTTGQILSNGVTTALDTNGAITIHGGANRTHVIIDRIGWLL